MAYPSVVMYWNNYYASMTRKMAPSPFSELVISKFYDRKLIIDVGCGSGRDAYLFASHGLQVLGLDVSEQAIYRAHEHCRVFADSCRFLTFDVGRDNLRQNDVVKAFDPEDILIYARFFLHAIPKIAEDAFLASVAPLVKSGSLLCLECRSLKDAGLPKTEGEHYRRFIDPDNLIDQLVLLGMNIRYSQVGRGLARYGSEDPDIIRVVAGAIND